MFITDFAEERGGIDFYLSEKGSAYTIAKKLQERFGGEIKQSSKNVGMKDSRQIFRMTCLIRLPAYRKGDFISLDKTLIGLQVSGTFAAKTVYCPRPGNSSA